MTGMASAINLWQGTLRSVLGSYVNGEYLRLRSRWLFPLSWLLSVPAVQYALESLGRANLALEPYGSDPVIVAFRNRLEVAFRSVQSNPDAALLGMLVEGYQVLEHLWLLEPPQAKLCHCPVGSPPDLQSWLADDRNYFAPVARTVGYIQSHMRQYLDSALLHGSVADLHLSHGYSDLDTLLVLKHDTVLDVGRLATFARLCYRSLAFLSSFDPSQHHGHMVMTAMDLEAYPETYLPLAALSVARPLWQSQNPISVRVRDCHAEALQSFEQDVDYFQVLSRSSWKPESGYDLKNYLSNLMLLPTHYLQAKGIFAAKRDSFQLSRQHLPSAQWEVMDYATRLREEWPYPFSPTSRWLRELPGFLNVQITKSAQHHLLPDQRDVSVLLSGEHLVQAANLAMDMYADVYRERSSVALAGCRVVTSSLAGAGSAAFITDHPTRRSHSEYAAARRRYTEQVAIVRGVTALYEFGTVAAPGFSDLDFLVAVSDQAVDLYPQQLSIGKLPYADKDLVLHEPIVIPESQLELVHDLLVGADLRELWRRADHAPARIPPNSATLPYAQAATLMEKLFSSLCWFEEVRFRPLLNARWAIAILRSLAYSVSLLEVVTKRRPPDSDNYLDALVHLRQHWLDEPSLCTKNDFLRGLFALGEQLARDIALELDRFLLINDWLRIDEHAISATGMETTPDSNVSVTFRKGSTDDDGRHVANLPISFLRLVQIYMQSAPRLAPALTVKMPREGKRASGLPGEFETYLQQRARRLEVQTIFLLRNHFWFGSCLPQQILQLSIPRK